MRVNNAQQVSWQGRIHGNKVSMPVDVQAVILSVLVWEPSRENFC